MSKAFLVKGACLALVALELAMLPATGLRLVLVAFTVLATLAFLAFVITSPRSQFFVPSVHELPASSASSAVAFTFDDGPDPRTTPRVLDLLAAHGATATFFVVGKRAAAHPELVRRIAAEGHALGSHTFRHSHAFHFLSPSRARAEIEEGMEAVRAITGEPPRLFRPPQGLRTPLLRDALSRIVGVVCVTWTERGLDTMGRSADRVVDRLAPAVREGAILTLHDGAGLGGTDDRRPTIDALGELLRLARERGLRCVSLACLAKGVG